MYTLVLPLCLHDPIIQQAASISNLLLLFCKEKRRYKETAAACSDHLVERLPLCFSLAVEMSIMHGDEMILLFHTRAECYDL